MIQGIEAFLEKEGLKYYVSEDGNKLVVTLSGNFTYSILFYEDNSAQKLCIYCDLELPIPVDKTLDAVMAVNFLNQINATGKFCVDSEDKKLVYEDFVPLIGVAQLEPVYYKSLVFAAMLAINEQYPRLYGLISGAISLKEFAANL